jgi:hypothetical protein
MNPLFFTAGEDFMKLVFENTNVTEDIRKQFSDRWNTLRKLSEKIFEFVRLQVNLLVRKDPENDLKIWKDFIIENIPLMNEEFFSLGRKVFVHLLDNSIYDKLIYDNFLESWDKTKETVMSIKEIPINN